MQLLRKLLAFITPAVVYAVAVMAIVIGLIAAYDRANKPTAFHFTNPVENYILEEYYPDYDH